MSYTGLFLLGVLIGARIGYFFFLRERNKRAINQLIEEIEKSPQWGWLCRDLNEENKRCVVCKHVRRTTPPECFVLAEED